MPVTCIVVGCGSRSERDSVSFFTVPMVRNYRFLTDLNDLTQKRRELWIAAINRRDLTESKLKYQRVCSKHFITGKPATLKDEHHPDWVPSQHMGYRASVAKKRVGDVERHERFKRRRKVTPTQEDVSVQLEALSDFEEDRLDVSAQTDLTMEELSSKCSQLRFALRKIKKLIRQIEESPFGLFEDQKNTDKWVYYTGYEYQFINLVIFPQIADYIPSSSTSELSGFNQLLLTLIKLRLDLQFKDLAYRFNISPTEASTYFANIIDIMYRRFSSLILWPDAPIRQKNIPFCFRQAFPNKTTVILDCFEISIEKPASFVTQQQCWSDYKHHHTIKMLIGITPQGSISYISKAWGGATSNEQIVELDDFATNLGIYRVKLIAPTFTRGKHQLHPLEFKNTHKIARVRIHVKRIIAEIKNKFNILSATIPISMLNNGNDPNSLNILGKIIVTCSALINLSPPIVPL
nr:unnamed protein product [Callosobruchus chinensis]